ncbi:MAG TPA: hypothetical protein VEI52_11070 [Terriglobales bacterium]|nr:hypothetical protein [Terriglobales bacterium]
MALNPTIVNTDIIPDVRQIVLKTCEPKPASLLQRIEVLLRKAFGDNEVTIANSLRGL